MLTDALNVVPDTPTREAVRDLATTDPYLWAVAHRRLRGRPPFYDVSHEFGSEAPTVSQLLRHRPFLVQPLRDPHPHKIYKKGRQVGVSELELTEAYAFLDSHPGTKLIYTFPRDVQLRDFSITRISESLKETPYMRQLVGVPNQIYTKRIGQSFMILRSAWESNLGEGLDADCVVLDEIDRMKSGIDVAFRECLQSSKWQLLRQVSTPTLPGRGVDEFWQKSCQYEWFVKCTKCGQRQTVRHPENVVQVKDVPHGAKQLEPGSYEYQCAKVTCRGPLDRLRGEWVPAYPSRTAISGYHMPQTIAPWLDATALMSKRIDYKYVQLWSNYALAECATGERVLVTDDHFYRCIAGHAWFGCRTNAWSRVTAGIDWGHENYVLVVGVNCFNNLPYLIGFAVFEDNDLDPLGSARLVEQFLRPFEPDIVVADAGYGKDRNAHLLKKFGDRFFAAYYNPSDRHARTFKPSFVRESNRVLADRTVTLKAACQAIRDQQIGLPAFDSSLKLVMDHFRALAPLTIEEDGEVYETIDKTGDDHLAHCLGYALLGFEYVTAGWSSFNISWE